MTVSTQAYELAVKELLSVAFVRFFVMCDRGNYSLPTIFAPFADWLGL
jgi:hypothetical protein